MNRFKSIALLAGLTVHLLCGAAPVSVQDDTGATIALPRPAQRVISLAPDQTEMLFSAGANNRVVGVMRFSDYPVDATRLPVVGDVQGLDMERIVALQPDLIVVWEGGIAQQQIERLRSLHVPLYVGRARHLRDIPVTIERFGQLMGTASFANVHAAELRARLSELTTQYAARDPVRVFYQVWDQPLFTLNGDHIVSDALQTCGAVNVFAGLKGISPELDQEAVLQADPEAIVGTVESHPSDGGVRMWLRYPAMTAVRRGNLLTLDGNLINRAGPRMLQGVANLCRQLEAVRQRRPAASSHENSK